MKKFVYSFLTVIMISFPAQGYAQHPTYRNGYNSPGGYRTSGGSEPRSGFYSNGNFYRRNYVPGYGVVPMYVNPGYVNPYGYSWQDRLYRR